MTATGLVVPTRRPRLPGPQAIPDALAIAAARNPDGEALIGRHRRLRYVDLHDDVRRAAVALAAAGVGPGDRVAGSIANHPELVVAFLASMHLGAIWVGVNRRLATAEKKYLLDDAGVSMVVGDHAAAAEIGAITGELPSVRTVIDAEPGSRRSEWAERLAAADPQSAPTSTVDPFAPAAIAYTSGTTGRPKGVVHSQHNLLLVGAVQAHDRVTPEDRLGVLLPLTILNLMTLGPVTALQVGCPLVCIDRVDAVGLAAWIRDERVTTLSAVPTIVHDLLTHPDVRPDDLVSLTRPGCGGGATPDSFRRLYEARFGIRLTTGYGLTEAPTAVTMEDPDLPAVPGASGRALPHVTVTIRDDDGRVLPSRETGEVCVGPALDGPFAGAYTPMLGYWARPDATAEALRGGLLHTGDLGHLTRAGDLVITDRKGDLIIRGGENVYPAEVERVLHEAPGVEACAVVGVPDDRLGERVVAAIIVQPGSAVTESALHAHCARSLSRSKVPEEFRVVDELPRNDMGKVVKRLVAAWFDGTVQR